MIQKIARKRVGKVLMTTPVLRFDPDRITDWNLSMNPSQAGYFTPHVA
jgi:hypothetical protein